MAAFTTSMTRVVALVFLVGVSRPYFQLDRKVHAKQKGKKKKESENQTKQQYPVSISSKPYMCIVV